jgi:nucleoside-diphosphate-sugar epimerase
MIFVTGGTGLLGSHLLFELTKSDTPVKAIFRNASKLEVVKRVFKFYDQQNGLERFNSIQWVNCDVLDVVTLAEEMEGSSHVYHCAAIVSFHRRDFNAIMKVNREGTANVVNCALDLGVEKLCYVSSTAAIGNGNNDPIVTEETKWKQSPTTSGYSIAKYSAEKEVWRGIEEGLNAVIVNPCVIIGAGDWNESSMTMFRTIDKGLKFYTEGENAFVDARDIAEIMQKLMLSDIQNERFLCIGENAAFKTLFDKIALRLNKKQPTILVKPWLMGITWRLMALISLLPRIKSPITQETARSAFGKTVYSNEKIKSALDFKFRTLDEMVENAVRGRF